MEKQNYSEEELYNKISFIENNDDSKVKLEYNITIMNNTKKELLEFIKNISEYYISLYDIEVCEWKIVYNDILIVIDFIHKKLYLCYVEDEIIENDIDKIIKSFSFLSPKYYDEIQELNKIKIYVDMMHDTDVILTEKARMIEENRKEINDNQNKQKFSLWKSYVEMNKTRYNNSLKT